MAQTVRGPHDARGETAGAVFAQRGSRRRDETGPRPLASRCVASWTFVGRGRFDRSRVRARVAGATEPSLALFDCGSAKQAPLARAAPCSSHGWHSSRARLTTPAESRDMSRYVRSTQDGRRGGRATSWEARRLSPSGAATPGRSPTPGVSAAGPGCEVATVSVRPTRPPLGPPALRLTRTRARRSCERMARARPG